MRIQTSSAPGVVPPPDHTGMTLGDGVSSPGFSEAEGGFGNTPCLPRRRLPITDRSAVIRAGLRRRPRYSGAENARKTVKSQVRRTAGRLQASSIAIGLTCLALLYPTATPAQDEWDGKANGQRTYPLGILGGTANVHLGKPDFEVMSLDSGGIAARGGLKVGDRIVGAGGKKFEEYDNNILSGGKGGPKGLGEALDLAMEKGTLKLDVIRQGSPWEVTITVPRQGALGDTWPLTDTSRIEEFREGICEHLNGALNGEKGRITVYGTAATEITRAMAGLALLASGETRYEKTVRNLAERFAGQTVEYGSNWQTYYMGVFMAEYFLATRDESVLGWIEDAVELIQGRMNEQGYIGHGGGFPDGMYGHAAGFNPVGSGSLWFMALAERCGVPIDHKKWTAAADNLERSSGKNGSVGYSNWARGGGDSHCRSSQSLLAMCVAQKKKPFQRSVGTFLKEHPGSVREAHAYSAPSVMATFLALYMYDEDECRRHFNLWKWYFTLAQQPDGSAAYIGSKRNNGGDTYLGKPHIMNASLGIILSAPKQRLYMYGGIPSIPGVAPGALSPRLLAILKRMGKAQPVQSLTALRNIVSMSPRGPDAEPAVLIGRTIYRDQVTPLWRAVLELNAEGDIYKTKQAFDDFVRECGRPPPLQKEMTLLEWSLSTPRSRAIQRRGKVYHDLVEKWVATPYSRPYYRKQFALLAQNKSDLYGRKANATIKMLEERDAHAKAYAERSEEDIEAERKLAL